MRCSLRWGFHDQRAELQVDTFGGGLGCQQDGRIVTEVFKQCGAVIHGTRA
jgi:hypothetical protein